MGNGVQLHAFLTSALCRVSGQLHTPAASHMGKEPTVSTG